LNLKTKILLSFPIIFAIILFGILAFASVDEVSLVTPLNGAWNITLKIWNPDGTLYYNVTNTTPGNLGETVSRIFTVSNIPENENYYLWNCLAYDNASESNWSVVNYTFGVDIGPGIDQVTLDSPANETWDSDGDVTFSCTANPSPSEHNTKNLES